MQIKTPIFAEGATPDAPLLEDTTVTANGTTLNVDARLTPGLLGYEMTWYSVQPSRELRGVSVIPLATERHFNGETERISSPIRNYFAPLIAAGFYGLFYKGGQTEFTALIVGGATRADLDGRIKLLETRTGSCEALNGEMCVTVPKRAAINAMVVVTVNGSETLLQWGATVGVAIGNGGQHRAIDVLTQLHVSRPYHDRLTPIEFKPSDSAILNLILMGGESISWK